MNSIDLDKLIVHAEYDAYVCMMQDHGCECLALTFTAWVDLR
jgi:hypothetical protein